MRAIQINFKLKLIITSQIILFLFLSNNTAISQVESEKDNKNFVKIDGDAEPANLADIPLPKYDYDIDSFDSGFNPHKELINLLDRPDELTGMSDANFMLEFPQEK